MKELWIKTSAGHDTVTEGYLMHTYSVQVEHTGFDRDAFYELMNLPVYIFF